MMQASTADRSPFSKGRMVTDMAIEDEEGGLTDRFQLQRIKENRAVDTSEASASARTIARCQLQTLLAGPLKLQDLATD
jgi:hypothetical protein